MNDDDYQNLAFLLNSDESVLRQWYDEIDEDDRNYAFALLTAFSWELLDEVDDCNPARNLLSNYFGVKFNGRI